MKATRHVEEGRKLHKKDCPQTVPVELGGYVGVPDRGKIAENNAPGTDRQADNLMENILHRDNLNMAYQKVKANKGACGVDGMQVDELLP